MKAGRVVMLCLVSLVLHSACGKRSPSQSYQKASSYLEQVHSMYLAISEAARVDGESRSKSLPYDTASGHKTDADNKVLTLLLLAYATASDAEHCAEAQKSLLNFQAQEKLQEKTTPEQFDKLIHILDDLSKSADNYLTNPKMIEATEAVERLQIREAQTLIKQAYDLIAANRPPE